MENFAKRPILTGLPPIPSCEESVSIKPEPLGKDFQLCQFCPGFHSFHIAFTAMRKESCAVQCKTPNKLRLPAQLLSQPIQHPVQIFIVLASLFNLLHRVQDGGVMLSAELTPNFRQ